MARVRELAAGDPPVLRDRVPAPSRVSTDRSHAALLRPRWRASFRVRTTRSAASHAENPRSWRGGRVRFATPDCSVHLAADPLGIARDFGRADVNYKSPPSMVAA